MTDEHLLVLVQDERYGLSVDDVIEVLRTGALTAVPGAAPVVLGLQNLRGQAIPVVDLAALLRLAEPGVRPYGVLVEHSGRRACLAVDAVLDMEVLDASTGNQDADGPLVGSALSGDVLVGLLDVPALLDATVAGAP